VWRRTARSWLTTAGAYTIRNLYGYAAMQRATQDSCATLCSYAACYSRQLCNAMQLCSVLLKIAVQRYAEHAALYGCNEYTTCSAATQPGHLQHVTSAATNLSLGFAGTDSIRCPRGCARESPRAGRRTRPPGDTSGSRKLLKLEVLQHTSIVLRTLLYRSMNEQTFEKLKYNKVGPCQNII